MVNMKKRILVFGCGKRYTKIKALLCDAGDAVEVVAFVDNDVEKQGHILDGKIIISVADMVNYEYDGVLVSSDKHFMEIREALIRTNVQTKKIWSYQYFCSEVLKGEKKRYSFALKTNSEKSYKARILILTTDMGISGGINVVIYLGKVLKDIGYLVEIASPYICNDVLEALKAEEITVYRHFSLPILHEEDRKWIKTYDLIIVNVFQMMNSAAFAVKERPVIWWIHEDRNYSVYTSTQKAFRQLHDNYDWMKKIYILAVSRIAEEAFNYYYPGMVSENLPFGIPDEFDKEIDTPREETNVNRLRLLIAGPYIDRKGYDILASSLDMMSDKCLSGLELWVAGPHGNTIDELQLLFGDSKNVKYLGRLDHVSMMRVMSTVDVVVCPSRVETMSMVIVEGMMFGKICVTTNTTGVSQYIKNGINGFIVNTGDAEELSNTIIYIYMNRNKLQEIQLKARETYLKFFSMDVFTRNVDRVVKKINNGEWNG